MNTVLNTKGNNNEDHIQEILNVLQKQIDEYVFEDENMKLTEDTKRAQRIEKLKLKERELSVQYEKIRKEMKHYERKYEKALKMKVKQMKYKVEEDRRKLEVIKQRYHEFNSKLDVPLYTVEKTKIKLKKNSESKTNVNKVKPMRLKQKRMPVSKKILIKIKRNKKLEKPEMHFVNDGNMLNAFTDSANAKPVTDNTQECKVMLQKLTEEQINQWHVGGKTGKVFNRPSMTRPKAKTKGGMQISLRNINGSKQSKIPPKWRISIPKSVFEESQKECGYVGSEYI